MPKHGISGASRQRHWRPETEESWRSAMLRTTSPGLNWAFWLPGPASWAGALAQRLQPAANTRLVVAVGVAEAPLEIGLLACDHAVAHSDGERQREDKNPWAGRLQADADNARHRRSKLVRLTRKGDARYRELSARFLAIASTMGAELTEADIRKSTQT